MILVLNVMVPKNVASSGVSTSMTPVSMQIVDISSTYSIYSSPLVSYLLVTTAGVYPTMSTVYLSIHYFGPLP